VADLAATVFERASGDERGFVQRAAIELLVELYLKFDQPRAREVLFALAESPSINAKEIGWIAWQLRHQGGLTLGALAPPDLGAEAMRARTFSLLERIARQATEDRLALFDAFDRDSSRLPIESEQREFDGLVQAADAVAKAIYFSSGAHAELRPMTPPDEEPLPHGEKRLFLTEGAPVFDALT
jgi:hypothetical protein